MQTSSSQSINILPIPAFNDNYIWALIGHDQKQVTVVDPGCANAVIQFIESNGYQLNSILVTHHHYDHVDGIAALLKYSQDKHWPINVYGPVNENIPHCSHKVQENDTVTLPHLDITFTVFDVPGHTAGHIAYYTQDALFCGDTLFSVGCGRLFDGTAEQLHQSLQKLSTLPGRTKVYCTHEYTMANINFALTVDPTNHELIDYFNQVKNKREQGLPTLPSTISLEKNVNPFLRTDSREIQQSVSQFSSLATNNALDTFVALRKLKDNF
ncbi:hydroxyacylglutathione hydrolase [Thalassotalea fusca]